MACDFSVAQDLARFGQAGPKHGSAPIGGATDFLPLIVGAERAMESCVLCEPSRRTRPTAGDAHRHRAGAEGRRQVRRQPAGGDERMVDEFGRIVFGDSKTGEAREEGKALMARGRSTSRCSTRRSRRCAPSCCSPSPTAPPRPSRSCASPSSTHWNRNKENSRAWLALNMMTEARAGFRAFNEGPQGRPRGRLRAAAPAARRRRALARLADRRHPAALSRPERWMRADPREGLAGARRRAAAPAPGAAEGQPGRRRDDRGAARGARAEHRRTHAARRAARCRGARTSASARASRSTCRTGARRCWSRCTRCLLELLESPAPVLVAVRGQCLGGGLELALACGPIFAAPDAQFGQPEIKLGVFAPAASCLLPYRVSQPAAEDLLLSGPQHRRRRGGRAIGLVRRRRRSRAGRARLVREHLQPKSAAVAAPAVARGARDAAQVARTPARARAPVPRRPDAHPRRDRRPRRLPGKAPAAWTTNEGRHAWNRNRSAIVERASAVRGPRLQRGAALEGAAPAARRSATCRSTCRAS